MSGNALFLVCSVCLGTGAADFGVKLAERRKHTRYTPRVPRDQFSAWLAKHFHEGSPPDHFQLAHLIAPNSDQSKLEGAVKLALVTG
jgi:hypothetical protein